MRLTSDPSREQLRNTRCRDTTLAATLALLDCRSPAQLRAVNSAWLLCACSHVPQTNSGLLWCDNVVHARTLLLATYSRRWLRPLSDHLCTNPITAAI